MLAATGSRQRHGRIRQGIADWRNLIPKFRALPHVIAVAPVLYDPEVFLSGQLSSKLEVTLKGITDTPSDELAASDDFAAFERAARSRGCERSV